MTPPTINTAKQLAYDHRATLGAVVLLFDRDGTIAGVSYGHTRSACALLGKLLDAIINGINDGTIDVDGMA
jgi:hypothetical protein